MNLILNQPVVLRIRAYRMLDLHFISTLLFGFGSDVAIPGSIRIQNGNNGSWDISSDEAKDAYIYTNYTDSIGKDRLFYF